ncbi:RIP metalloprotease RseP [Ideonella sp. DXS22W]|uniref:Zinc metalloprotease n=1 Tax=Pseudaquabacterium inlustre TaxID=2984192 RepID=A0ABU9CFC1_9BURK
MISTVFGFLLTLGVLILVHEWGHYQVARWCGVKVLRFSMGFGRVIWRRQKSADDTEFVLSALPLGGYVRMLDEREGPVAPSLLGQAFNRKLLWQRAAIVAAGPLTNLLLAVLLYAAAQWIGVKETRPLLSAPVAGSVAERAGMRAGDWVQAWQDDDGQWVPVQSLNELRWQVTQHALRGEPLALEVSDAHGRGRRQMRLALDELGVRDIDAAVMRRIGLGQAFSEPILGEVKAGGPAAQAGLRKGDRVLMVDDRLLTDAAELFERIRAAGQGAGDTARSMVWRVQRDGRELTLTVTPRLVRDGERRIGRIDAYVGGPLQTVLVRLGPLDGLHQGLVRTGEVALLSLRMIGRMLIGEASVKNLSGPLTIADVAGQSIERGLAYYLGFLAMVSVSLGVLNLLPLPMLDGGHLLYFLFEGMTGRPVSDQWLARLQRGGIAILLLMMSVALYNDVARLVGLH